MHDRKVAASPLDSERFGIAVARADGVTAERMPSVLDYCREHGIELLIARSDAADVASTKALVDAGLVPLEGQITYRAPLRPRSHPDIREGAPDDREAMAALAGAAFDGFASHYHLDSRLDAAKCRDGYVDWTLRGLAGDAADVFYVAEVDGEPAAFGMFSQQGAESVFVLSAVAEPARGRGLYSSLLHHGMSWATERGAESMIGITPYGNVPAQRNLIKAGFRPVASATTFHGWRDRLFPVALSR